ncbi:MAG: IS21 family transposase [Candidatus Thermoplasmatota archaeon]|nr:IS21 family transposase [Candidatus Thermoplasmatota archaeon]
MEQWSELFGLEEWRMIRNMKENGMSIKSIARELHISRNSVRKYIKSEPSKKARKRKASKLDPYRDKIRDLVEKYNLSTVRILEELRKLGYTGGYTILKEYCHDLRKDRRILAVYRYETDPGKQSQVDFGEFGHIDVDGKRRKLYAFSIILGYSRMRYAEFTTDISTENVIKMHLNAFRYFGGYTDTILYDNMKQVVLERRIRASESVFNGKFRDFSEYYGIIVRLCYPYRAQTKGKIENTIKYVRYNFWAGRSFSDLNDINRQCIEWLNKVNAQIHGTTHRIPVDLLPMENLNTIDRTPEYFTRREETRKISRDCYISWKGNRYSVPWIYAGREALVTEESLLRIRVDSNIIAEHEILPGSGRISRNKKHFEGLLKAIRDENTALYTQMVEKRDLSRYEEAS